MWLLLDIGNSAVKAALYEEGHVLHTFRMESNPRASAAAYRHTLQARLEGWSVTRIGLVSVVPELTEKLTGALQALFMVPPEHIHTQLELPFDVQYDRKRLGQDRLAAVAGAIHRYGETGEDLVVLDAGTALTLEVVRRGRVYEGGLIAPGPALMQDALATRTAQLPPVPLQLPGKPWGQDTVEAIQTGVLYGFVEMVRGLLTRVEEHLNAPVRRVATGGWAPLLQEHLALDALHPHLVFEGMAYLMSCYPEGIPAPSAASQSAP